MEQAIDKTEPATNWGGLFSDILSKAVDTGSALALQNADTKQKEALASQATAAEQAKAQAAAATASATKAETSANWQKIALYAGLGVVGLVVIGFTIKALRAK